MLFANMIVDAFAAMGCMVFMIVAGVAVLAAKFAKSDLGKSLVDGLKKPEAAKPQEKEEREEKIIEVK